MIIKLLTEHYLEFLSLKGGCRGPSESTHVIMSNCWKSHAAAQFISNIPRIKALNGSAAGECNGLKRVYLRCKLRD